MKLALLCPVEWLNYTELLPGRFCIASVARRHPHYANYFARQKDVILDTGAFEGDDLTDQEYGEVIERIKPKVVIVPDLLHGNAYENIQRADQFLTYYHAHHKHPVEFMYVLQAHTESELWESLSWAIYSRSFQWIGLPRTSLWRIYHKHTKTNKYTEQEQLRWYFTVELSRRGYIELTQEHGIKWHYLGMGPDTHFLRYYWFVESMDTAWLFWSSIDPNRTSRPPNYFEWQPEITAEGERILKVRIQMIQQKAEEAHARRTQD